MGDIGAYSVIINTSNEHYAKVLIGFSWRRIGTVTIDSSEHCSEVWVSVEQNDS
jgi:hypothetical protein